RGNEGQLDQEEAEMEPLVEPQFARVPAFRPRPDLDDLKKAVQYLERAERPVIVAGGGVRWSGAGPELVALAEALGSYTDIIPKPYTSARKRVGEDRLSAVRADVEVLSGFRLEPHLQPESVQL